MLTNKPTIQLRNIKSQAKVIGNTTKPRLKLSTRCILTHQRLLSKSHNKSIFARLLYVPLTQGRRSLMGKHSTHTTATMSYWSHPRNTVKPPFVSLVVDLHCTQSAWWRADTLYRMLFCVPHDLIYNTAAKLLRFRWVILCDRKNMHGGGCSRFWRVYFHCNDCICCIEASPLLQRFIFSTRFFIILNYSRIFSPPSGSPSSSFSLQALDL